jgi:glycogen debranching enzyme
VSERELRARVDQLYRRNRQVGAAPWCGAEYDFVCPSEGTYPFQWFWDSCFHAIVLTHLDLERAKAEIRSLLVNAQPDGLVPHVTFWQRERYEEMLATYAIAYRTPYLSDCMQPPLLAEAVAAIVERGGGLAFAREVMPAVRRYYDWLDRVRDPDRDGLIAVLQPDETGLDHTPKFDDYLGVTTCGHAELTAAWHRVAGPYAEVGRDPEKMFALDRFVVEDVMVNTIYAENQRVLGGLLAELGDAAGAAEMRARAGRTAAALLARCWDPARGLFFDLAGRAERRLETVTFTCLFPLLLPDLPAPVASALASHLEDPRAFAADYPVPTVAMSEPSFCPDRLPGSLVFRGTTWLNVNWYLARGLRRHGRADLARRIEERSAELVLRSGFREYYNPHSGEGYGAEGFSWSALALDMLAARPS